MKKVISILVILLSIVTVCYAHSGRTDGYGGHYNRSTGTYHYHSGQYANTGEYTAPIEEGGHLIGADEEDEGEILTVAEDTPREIELYKENNSLKQKLEEKDNEIEELNHKLEDKNEEIQKTKDDKGDSWIIFGFIFIVGIYISYNIGKNKE